MTKTTVSIDDRLIVLATALNDLKDFGLQASVTNLYHDGYRSVIIVIPGLVLTDGYLTLFTDGAIGGGG